MCDTKGRKGTLTRRTQRTCGVGSVESINLRPERRQLGIRSGDTSLGSVRRVAGGVSPR